MKIEYAKKQNTGENLNMQKKKTSLPKKNIAKHRRNLNIEYAKKAQKKNLNIFKKYTGVN